MRTGLNYCLHLGGPMKGDGDKLVCEWHGAEFARADGHCLKGPARPETRLIVLPTRVEDGVLTYCNVSAEGCWFLIVQDRDTTINGRASETRREVTARRNRGQSEALLLAGK